MAKLTLEGLGKVYGGGVRAVEGLNLNIGDGEFMVLVGPSGCGKTTVLRMVAGLEEVSEGEIRIDETVVSELPAARRDIAMVFQNYALYPHMTVFENIAFPLRSRRLPGDEIKQRVDRAATMLGLTEVLKRKPRALSGGQRQRVAMGRAIVREPRAFLMDEPLSNLDARLRMQMRSEISTLQADLAVTTIYVTHDQVEAMTMGSRIAVMRGGLLQQQGVPQDVYDRPANLFVATFLGSPGMNLMRGKIDQPSGSGELVFHLANETITLPLEITNRIPRLADYRGGEIALGVRPEDVRIADDEGVVLAAEVVHSESLGPARLVHVTVEADPVVTEDVAEVARDIDTTAAVRLETEAAARRVPLVARVPNSYVLSPGDRIPLGFRADRVQFFDLDTGAAIR